MKARTEIDFDYMGDAHKIIREWSSKNKYNYISIENDMRVYQKGGFWTFALRLAFIQNRERVHIEAFIYVPPIHRLTALYLIPKEISLEENGAIASFLHTLGRKHVNQLLDAFGQPPLK